MIIRLPHVQITTPVAAEAEARTCYCGLLGLAEIEKPDSLEGRSGFWLRVAAQEAHIGVEAGVQREATKAHIAYQMHRSGRAAGTLDRHQRDNGRFPPDCVYQSQGEHVRFVHANMLVSETGILTYRLETDLPLTEARRAAESLR